jgi:ornithine cyclodeaminase
MGSDQSEKNELDPAVLAAADLYVCDRASQAEALGELRTALASGHWTRGTPTELGAVVAGSVAGRPSAEAITVCDLTGTGAQDTAIATHALAAARAAGAGTTIRV